MGGIRMQNFKVHKTRMQIVCHHCKETVVADVESKNKDSPNKSAKTQLTIGCSSCGKIVDRFLA